MILFYSTSIENDSVILKEEEHIHCSKVLRKQINDEINVTDGKGNLYICKISEINKFFHWQDRYNESVYFIKFINSKVDKYQFK